MCVLVNDLKYCVVYKLLKLKMQQIDLLNQTTFILDFPVFCLTSSETNKFLMLYKKILISSLLTDQLIDIFKYVLFIDYFFMISLSVLSYFILTLGFLFFPYNLLSKCNILIFKSIFF